MIGDTEERARLDAAVKANDGFFTTFFVSPYSKYLARSAARHGWTPNAVTFVSFAVGLGAAACFAVGSRWASVAGALLLQVSFTADCVDGQLARYTRTFSSLGAWLDSVLDRTKEHVVYAGLAIGAARGYDEDVWLLACCALALLTVRHLGDAAYAAGRGERLEASARTGARMWLARVLAFPIGERFAAISLTAAAFTPRITFVVLLAWGGLATASPLVRRLTRGGSARGDYRVLRDDGWLAGRLLAGAKTSWLSAQLARVVELGAVIAIVALADSTALPTCFAFLAVLAFHQYDTILRLEQGRAPLPSGGWEGHVLLVAIAALLGALGLFFIVVTTALGAYFLAETAFGWLRVERKRVHMEDAR